MAAPGSFTSGSVLTAAEMNALPGGEVVNTVLGGATPTTTVISTTNQNILVDSTVLVAGRKYLASVNLGNFNSPSTSLFVRARVFVEGSREDALEFPVPSGTAVSSSKSFVFTAAGGGGNHYVEIDTSTGTVNLFTQDGNTISSFVIIDLGTN